MAAQRSPALRLPPQLTSFVGRESEVLQARTLLRGTRLLTLTGPGGSGKTRLALETAIAEQDSFPDGVTFVSLAATSEPAFVIPTIATELNVRLASDRTAIDGLASIIGDRSMLLVLDNFEQIVAAAPLVAGLLSRCSALKVIVTSRVALHVSGEQHLPVQPLAIPDLPRSTTIEEILVSPAVRLFVERAGTIDPSFRITENNAAAIVEVCRRVDGLPLAIELAAARLSLFSPQTLAERLHHRLALLTGGARDAPIRQQTIQDTIAWSYDLLSPDEQRLFRLASIFAGGWTFEAIEAISAEIGIDVLDTLSTLVDHNLVKWVRLPSGDTRYEMLETIREYGLDRLHDAHETHDVQSRHAAYILEFVELASPSFVTGEQSTWSRRVLGDIDNIRAALRWSIDASPVQAVRIATALGSFWLVGGYVREGRQWIESALAREPATPASIRARAMSEAGELACWQGDFEASKPLLEAARDLFLQIGDVTNHYYALFTLARLAHFQGELERADALYEQSTHHHREVDNWYAVAGAIGNRGTIALSRGDIEQATTLLSEALELCLQHGFVIQVAIWTRELGRLAIMTGDRVRARELLTEAIRIDAEITRARIPEDLELFAALLMLESQPQRAAELLGAADRLRQISGMPVFHYLRAAYELDVRTVRQALGESDFEQRWRRGTAMTIDEAVALALATPLSASNEVDILPGPRLTTREIEVLRLLVEGQSDREIAAALFISPYTVARHVQNMLNKLALPSRTAVATYAIRHGLV